MNWIDNALGIYPQALSYRSQRSSVLAANIANADTPGFKARDYDFQAALRAITKNGDVGLSTTRSGHLNGSGNDRFGALKYRVPTKPVANGNSVEQEVEQAAFAENAVRYQTTLQFIDGAFSTLRLAIRGRS